MVADPFWRIEVPSHVVINSIKKKHRSAGKDTNPVPFDSSHVCIVDQAPSSFLCEAVSKVGLPVDLTK